jgi:Uri superfamily endonuclease
LKNDASRLLIRSRVKRHFRFDKKAHWHIDWLTVRAVEMLALAVADGHECELVEKLLKSPKFKVAAAGFGSTDCRLCESHLLTIPRPAPRQAEVKMSVKDARDLERRPAGADGPP